MIRAACRYGTPASISFKQSKKFVVPIEFSRRKSHYTILEVEPSASQKDIKSAYYKLSLKFHPDKNKNDPASVEKFRQITEAYEVIGNPDKRKTYDMQNQYRTQFNQDPTNLKRRTYGQKPYYNVEEHYRQHYEEYMRYRNVEQEHFRRRWGADRRTRYGDYSNPSSHDRQQEEEDNFKNSKHIRKTTVYLMTFWTLMLVISFFNFTDKDVPRRDNTTIYYNISDRNVPKKDGTIYYDISDRGPTKS